MAFRGNKTRKQQTEDERRIDKAYRRHCAGLAISVLDIGKVFAFGQIAIDRGDDDAALGSALLAYVRTLAK